MRWTPRALLPLLIGFFIVLSAGVALALPATTPDNTGMVDFPGAGGSSNAVAVRTIAQAGSNVWVMGKFTEIDDQNGNKVQDANNVAVFNATSGSVASGVHIPDVTQVGGGAEIYDASVGPDGNVYFAGNFDHVDGQTRNNVAAINGTTGALTSFNPGTANANAILATSSAIYVGTAKLLSFQLNGAATPGWTSPEAIVDAGIRAHATLPQFRDIVALGSTIAAACQCDSLTDAVGTRDVKAVVEINASNGRWINWVPAGLDSQSAAFGINLIVHNAPGTSTPMIYLAAGGSDFTAAYNFATGAQPWKEDTSGSSQAITWYQNNLIIGGHYDWTQKAGASGSCGDNASPNPSACWHSPKLAALDPANGNPILIGGAPWNPGICCKYNGVWALYTGLDGSTLNVGGEFTKVGGTWSGSGTNWTLSNASTQQFWARFGGPAATTQPLTLQKTSVAGATGTVTSSPSGINCNSACSGAQADFNTGTTVTLTATPSVGNSFLGWSGDCTGTGSCVVTMSQARTVTASFAGVTFPLTVTKNGTAAASGSTVTSNTGGINCGSTCSAQIPQNTVVTLTAAAGANVQFAGWSGEGCSGTGTCQVTMTQARNVTATFNSTLATLTVNKATTTTGKGTVTSTPGGISCANACNTATASFSVPMVTLQQSPGAGDVFGGWTSSDPGFDCPTLGDCTVTMDMARTVVAHFEDAHNIKVTTLGTGGGTVTSDPAKMNCPAPSATSCDTSFADNSTVTVIATADTNSVFSGWSNGGTGQTAVNCTGTDPCVIDMGTNAKKVNATFDPAFPLTVHPDGGSGGGTVTSAPTGIDCGLTCGPVNFKAGTNVILSAVPDENSTFTGWSGEGCSGTGTCGVTMSQARNVTATFTLVQRPLTVHVIGQGNVTDSPGPIDCNTGDTGTCSSTYEHGTDVELIATPATNWQFSGWSGDCSGTDQCIVSMTASHNVTATFERIIRSVNVSMGGSGQGSVTSSPSGIDCPGDCSEGFGQGDSVTLTPHEVSGSVFTGWSGDCSGTDPCMLTIDGEKNVTATFELLHTLTVNNTNPLLGTVTSSPAGIDCGSTCSHDYAHNTIVQLTATPQSGSAFAGWTGDCTGSDETCDVTIDTARSVTATWGVGTTLTVTKPGSGSGTVTSTPSGINCGGTCSHDFPALSSVTLHASTASGSAFTGWGGDGASCGTAADCQVTMTTSLNVTATFTPSWLLTVQRTGAGGGTVTSDVGAINCGGTCSDTYVDGTIVTLHAADGPNSTFASWGGDTGGNCPGTADCVVTMDQARSISANYNAILHQLSVTKTGGTGTGTVTSLDPNLGIDCGSTCAFDFQQGTSVVLHAVADASSTFITWTSGDPGFSCPGTGDCTVTMDQARTVNAQFDLAQRLLTVNKLGNGNGSITSNDTFISCPGTCSHTYTHGGTVQLTANVGANSTFTGWSGDTSCNTTNPCSVTMDQARNISATFALMPRTLTVAKGGNGTGTVSANTGVINCGATCSGQYDHGTSVILTATPDANMQFIGWSSADSGFSCPGTGTCTVTMDQARTVTATFNKVQHTLTAATNVTGGATGTVTSNVGTINCPGTCANAYDHGTVVQLTATPTNGSTFAGWSGGGCSGNSNPCTVTLNADTTVTASFTKVGTIPVPNNDPVVQFNGWVDVQDGTNFYRQSNVKNDKITFKTVATTSVQWLTRVGPDGGNAKVTIDGTVKETFNEYAAAAAYTTRTYSGLANKVHTVVITVVHTKSAASSDYFVRLDGFKVGTTTTQESDPKVQYDTWKSTANTNATDGTYRSSKTATATVTVKFTGTSIDLIATKGKAYGKAKVTLDGGTPQTIDLYKATTAWQQVFNFPALAAGNHTLVIQVLNQKNPSATATTVVIDGFVVHA